MKRLLGWVAILLWVFAGLFMVDRVGDLTRSLTAGSTEHQEAESPAPTPFVYRVTSTPPGFVPPTLTPAPISTIAAATPTGPLLAITRFLSPALDFTLPVLDGGSATLSDFRGQIVLINFWASWCLPCRLEMPAIERLFSRYRDRGFTVLAVNVEEPEDIARSFMEELGLTFPVLLDSRGSVNRLYAVMGLPTSFFVDAEGMIYRQAVGGMTEEQIEAILHEMWAE